VQIFSFDAHKLWHHDGLSVNQSCIFLLDKEGKKEAVIQFYILIVIITTIINSGKQFDI
jgi:hypothetical protein